MGKQIVIHWSKEKEFTNILNKDDNYVERIFLELRKLANEVLATEKVDDKIRHGQLAKKINRHLRSFFGEERVERGLARNNQKLFATFEELKGELDSEQRRKIFDLLEQVNVFDAKLKVLGARGGKIEKEIAKMIKNPQDASWKDIESSINEALETSQSLESAIKELLKEWKIIRILKSRIPAVQHSHNIALLKEGNKFILFDSRVLDEILEIEKRPHSFKVSEEEKEYWNNISKEAGNYHVNRGQGLLGSSQPVNDPITLKFMFEGLLGYAEVEDHNPKTKYLGALEIARIVAKKGWGPYFFELIFSYASTKHKPVIIDRRSVTPAAIKVWEYFDEQRRHIIKYPAALRKYPELVGYSKQEVMEKFGSGSLGSTFDAEGYPVDMSLGKLRQYRLDAYNRDAKDYGIGKKAYEEGVEKIKNSRQQEGTYLKKEITNQVIGENASLDKAYYYDGLIDELKVLIKRSKAYQGWSMTISEAGEAYFLSFAPGKGRNA